MALSSSNYLLSLINDLLDFSSINNQNFRLNIQEIDISKINLEIKEILINELQKKNIQAFVEEDTDLIQIFEEKINHSME
jgi:signal transduction histidine kinase